MIKNVILSGEVDGASLFLTNNVPCSSYSIYLFVKADEFASDCVCASVLASLPGSSNRFVLLFILIPLHFHVYSRNLFVLQVWIEDGQVHQYFFFVGWFIRFHPSCNNHFHSGTRGDQNWSRFLLCALIA